MIRVAAVSLFFIFAAFFATALYAQDKKLMPLTKYVLKDTTKGIKRDTDEQKDLKDVIQSLFRKNYEPAKVHPIGSKPIISFVPAIGYSLQTETAGTLTGNIVFR